MAIETVTQEGPAPKACNVSPAALQQAQLLANQIAGMAVTAHQMAVNAVEEYRDDQDESCAMAVKALANQIGWLADVLAVKLGGMGVLGGPEEWMLPPAVRKLAQARAGLAPGET